MNLYRGILKITTFFVVIFLLASCDDDFSNVGGSIIENPSGVQLREYDVNAYTIDLKSLQTNNSNPKLLGVYNHPVYGQKIASVLSQLNLGETSPEFPADMVLDSVVLNLPYYSTEGEADEDGKPNYNLDSIYGSGSFKLSISESNYFLNNYDPNEDFEKRQKYYSDQQDLFEQFLNPETIYSDENFTPSANTMVFYEENEDGELDTIYKAPSLRVHLNKDYFQEKIINKEGGSELSSQSNFDEYFRGLFFKAEANGDNGSMVLFSFTGDNAGIKLYYNYTGETTNDNDETVDTTLVDSLALTFAGNIVNTFKGEYPAAVESEIASQDLANGSENLYLDGGEGTLGVVELFNNGELEDLKEENLIINEANLELYLNTNLMDTLYAPKRLYLYDLNNNSVLIDYSIDPSTSDADAFSSKTIFSSQPETNEDTGETKYTLRITQHIVNLLDNDSTNVKLGVAVTSNINQTARVAVKESTPARLDEEELESAPAASTITPEGAVFYGSNATEESKKLKLKIYYTDADL